MENLLVVVPMYPGTEPVRASTFASVAGLQWNGRLDVLWMRNDSPVGGWHYVDLADKLNRAAQIALQGRYAGMVVIEADMVVPSNALQRLYEVDAEIVYGLYCSRTSRGHQWLLAKGIDEQGVQWPTRDELRGYWGSVVQSSGVGLGCTLIKREALLSVAFRTVMHGFAPDWYLAVDAQEDGIRQAHHCGVVCGHVLDDRRVVWPDPDATDLYRIEEAAAVAILSVGGAYRVLPGQRLAMDGEGRAYEAGEVVTLGEEVALKLIRRGVVECA